MIKKWLKPSLLVLLVLFLAAVFAPLLAPHDPAARLEHAGGLGLDSLRRDVFSRLLYGNRNAVFIAFLGSVGACSVGLIMGAVAALGPWWIRKLFKMMLQAVLSIPIMIILLLGVTYLEPGVGALAVLITLALWTETARLVQAAIEAVGEADFVLAARMRGEGAVAIFIHQILPNLKTVLGEAFLLTMINAVLMESVLSYLGLGLPLGVPSLGNLIDNGIQNMFAVGHALYVVIAVLLAWLVGLRSLLQELRQPPELHVERSQEC